MQESHGIFKATAATLYVGCGFRPDWVEVINLTDLTGHIWQWDDLVNRFGVTRAKAGDWAQAASAAYGIAAYDGGDKMTAASTAYIVPTQSDQRGAYDPNAPIAKFTVGSVANKTGNFDVEASTTYVGVGSRIAFAGYPNLSTITAMSNNGKAANEVTLDTLPVQSLSAVTVARIWPMFDFMGAANGVVIPAGFSIGASAVVNDTNTDKCMFIAKSYSL